MPWGDGWKQVSNVQKITCAEKACASLLVFLAILKLFISHDARIAPSSQLQTITKIHSKYAEVIF